MEFDLQDTIEVGGVEIAERTASSSDAHSPSKATAAAPADEPGEASS